ncbi:uncharacterized protein A1O9_06995 [Exophiala aquamarina CBS 119918]|uniref:Uncharacterized protein n=1 Tax=Exophiala aquamarina CBS 119918 TaxID=1182545 RepID=A0A072PMS7_9EURO|nr:uncharacterized protein A1O9_06995 [Exophiala aquamarina CBS 119918]KEF56805.1 hypothetical protein A1O9_06995 [Exophiala aquamarina CBS 119918]
MALRTDGEVLSLQNGTNFESDGSVLPGKRLQHIKELIDSVKVLSAEDSFKHADSMFDEMAHLKRTVEVNQDQVGGLESQLQQLKTNSRIAQQEFLATHRETVRSIVEEKSELQVKLDRAQNELESQEMIHKKQLETQQGLQYQNTTLTKESQSLRGSVLQIEDEVKDLKGKSVAKDNTITQLQQKLERKERDMLNIEGNMRALAREKDDLRNQFEASDGKLKMLMDFSYPLSSDSRDDVRNLIRGIWQSCLDIVKRNIGKDLPVPEKEEDLRAWTTLKHVREATHATPIPSSNTHAAKQMRTFLIIEQEDELRDALFEITDNPKKAFLRGMIMSLFETRQREISTKRVSKVVREVLSPVEDLLGLNAAQRFGQELKLKVIAAKDVWWHLQRQQSYFEADNDTETESWERQSIQVSTDDDQTRSQAVNVEAFDTDEAVLKLFPRIFIVDGSRDTPIFPGVVLQKSQTASAEQEICKAAASSPTEGKQGPAYRLSRARRTTASNPGKPSRDEEKGSFLGSRG